jgi:hypothetical protein
LIASNWISSAQNGHFFFSGSAGAGILLNSQDNADKIWSTFFLFLPKVISPLAKKPSPSMNPPDEMPVFGADETWTSVLFGDCSISVIGMFSPQDIRLMPAFTTTRPLRWSDEWMLIPSMVSIAASSTLKTVRLSKGNSAAPELFAALIGLGWIQALGIGSVNADFCCHERGFQMKKT